MGPSARGGLLSVAVAIVLALALPSAGADPLDPRPVTDRHGWQRGPASVHTAATGEHVVVWTKPRTGWTAYRLYDAAWKPTSRTLAVRAPLEIVAVAPDGFVGHAVDWNGRRTTLDEWVRISPTGAGTLLPIRAARHPQRRPVPIRAGDVAASWGQLTDPFHFYRPASNRMLYRRAPAWMGTADPWYDHGAGYICSYPDRSRRGLPVRTSTDHGVTWTRTSTDLLPEDSGRFVHYCLASSGGTVVVTGDSEYLRWVHTLDPATGDVLSSHRLGTRRGQSLNPYELQVFADGTLVAGTRYRGVYVATDPTNATLRFRPADLQRDTSVVTVVGADLVATVFDQRHLRVSSDRGVTWATVDPRFARR
ncbi:hypothetical protein [Nocardioides sp. SR21]|uniref:hypothetical protein n=1 Tax=Nocardioides sp. SR21 TaxID=2919501 RepID=UPI001FAB1E09|nr:hypothetical protein [Nocardioides sp. SR21]